MVDIDPWKYPNVVEVVEEAHGHWSPFLDEEAPRPTFYGAMVIFPLKVMMCQLMN